MTEIAVMMVGFVMNGTGGGGRSSVKDRPSMFSQYQSESESLAGEGGCIKG